MAQYKGAASEGGRASILMKKRQKEQEELEHRKKKIEEEMQIGSIQNKFATHYDAIEQQLKSNTIGKTTHPFIFSHIHYCAKKNIFSKTLNIINR